MIEKWIEIRKHDSIGLKAHQIMFDMKTCLSWLNLRELSCLPQTSYPQWERKSMKTLEDKTMTGKTAVNLPAGNPSQPSYWFWTTPMGSSDGKPEGRRHFGADRFRLENQGNVSMSEDYAATVINRINTINAKTNSSRNFQLAAWKTVWRKNRVADLL